MKQLKTSVLNRVSILSLISIAVILFSISSIDKTKKHVVFEVVESKVSISGTGSSDQWKMEANAITCEGNFEVSNQELLDISELSFILPINQLKSNNHQLESSINEALKQNNCNQIIFKQRFSMILPIMKKIHVIGELSMLNGKHSIPLQVSYELSNNETLKIKSKQTISLKQCGIKLPSHMEGMIDDEVELEIDFLLVNKSI